MSPDPTAIQFAKRASTSNDEDEEDDDDDTPKKKKPAGPNWLLIVGGGCGFLTLLLCVGGGFLGYYLYSKGKEAVGNIQAEMKNIGGKVETRNNLMQIGLAMHGSHDRNKALPSHAIMDFKTNQPLLSWRVQILEDLNEGALFNQIRRNEPWDSAHNKQFWNKIPKAYQMPGKPVDGNTYYQAFVGKGSAFPKANGPGMGPDRVTLVGITDGSSNTIFVVEAANPVNWMKPDDIPFEASPKGVPLSAVGNHWGDDSFFAVMGDGSVRRFPRATTTPQMLQSAITRAGGEIVALPD